MVLPILGDHLESLSICLDEEHQKQRLGHVSTQEAFHFILHLPTARVVRPKSHARTASIPPTLMEARNEIGL